MSKTKHKKKILVRNIIISLLIVLLFVGIVVSVALWENAHSNFTSNEQPYEDSSVVELNGTKYQVNPNVRTVLFMGLDKFEGEIDNSSYVNDQQADFLLLLAIDEQEKTYSAIHINRDAMAQMNVLGVAGDKIDTVTQQVALSHTYGNGREVSCRNTVDAVSNLLLNTKIEHYVSMTMDAVPVYNDLVGGVEVTVLDDFTGIDESLVKGETVKLLGQQSLRYVRTRYNMEDSSNNARMLRQQQYMDALLQKTRDCMANDDEFVVRASVQMSEYFISDRSANQLQGLFDKLGTYTYNGIRSLEGDMFKGERFMEFYPDEDALKELIVDLFYLPIK